MVVYNGAMKAVVLMAGKGSRMAKTHTGPKQLMHVAGKPILEHTLDNLPDIIDELTFVVGGPHEDAFRAHFAQGHYNGRPITFVQQENPQGTAHGYWTAQPHVDGRFLGFYGDDIIGADGLEALTRESDYALLARRVPDPGRYGVFTTDADGYLTGLIEKPTEPISDLVWTGALMMDAKDLNVRVPLSPRGEYEVTTLFLDLVHKHGKRFRVIETNEWIPVNDHHELERAHQSFAQNIAL